MTAILGDSTLLRQAHVRREVYDPRNDDHMLSFIHFLRTGNWGEIQFLAEAPYTDVPMTVLMKYAQYTQGAPRETTEQRAARLEAIPHLIQFPKPKTQAQIAEERAAALLVSNEVLARLNATA